MERRYFVYRHITPDGLIYVGATSFKKPEKRWGNGKCYQANKRFTDAVNFFGWDNIKHEILAEGLPKEEAHAMERELIRVWDTTNPEKGYNILDGDLSTKIYCVELDRTFPSLHDAARETHIKRDSLKSACTGQTATAGGYHWCYEKDKATYEIDPNRRGPRKKKAVINIDTGKVYESAHAAFVDTGVCMAQIWAVCAKKPNRKSAGGYRWAFASEVI